MDNRLPDICYSMHNVTGQLIILKRGISVYFPYKDSYEPTTLDVVNELNEKLGVTVAQRKAMESGSMFGWEVPASTISLWEEKLKKANVKI